jgi:hypothetical protein
LTVISTKKEKARPAATDLAQQKTNTSNMMIVSSSRNNVNLLERVATVGPSPGVTEAAAQLHEYRAKCRPGGRGRCERLHFPPPPVESWGTPGAPENWKLAGSASQENQGRPSPPVGEGELLACFEQAAQLCPERVRQVLLKVLAKPLAEAIKHAVCGGGSM